MSCTPVSRSPRPAPQLGEQRQVGRGDPLAQVFTRNIECGPIAAEQTNRTLEKRGALKVSRASRSKIAWELISHSEAVFLVPRW
jgi:hypothetical protein